MVKKIIILILGLAAIMGIQYFIASYVFNGSSDYAIISVVFWMLVYYTYFKQMEKRFLKW